jgi:predicted small secreted protein
MPDDHTNATFKDIFVRDKISRTLSLLILVTAAPLLGACHTTAGAGQDLTATGHAVTDSAVKHTP